MSILDHLKKDHKESKNLLSKIIKADDATERESLFDEFAAEISAHNEAERSVLYKRLQDHPDGREAALEGEEEHEVANRVLESLHSLSNKASERWTARATVLKDLLEHHVEEEEDQVFEKARELFDDAELTAMGEEFLEKKHEMT